MRRWANPILLVVVLVAGTFQVHNLDIHLHARTGQWMVEHGEVPTTNVLSGLDPAYPCVHDKWLFQLAAHAIFDGLGPGGVITIRLALMVALFAVMAATARRLGATETWLATFALLALVAMRTRFMFRPGLVSLLLLALVVHVILARRPDGRRTWPLLPLQLLWANTHGYFILGPLAVFAVAGGHLLRGRAGWGTARRFTLLGAGMAAMCLINPAGLDGAMHPLEVLRDLRTHYDFYSESIVEFRGSFHPDPRQPWDRFAFFALLGASAVLLAIQAWRDRPAFAWPALLLVLLLFSQTLSLRRNMAPFAVVVAPLAAAAATRRRQDGTVAGTSRLSPVLPLALAGVITLGEMTDATSIHDGIDRRWGWGLSDVAYPDAGIDFIANEFPDVRVIYTDFGYGSTFTGRRWPEQVALTDGNTHGYPTTHLMAVMGAASGRDVLNFDELTRQHGLDVALIPMAGPLSVSLVRTEEWGLVHLGHEEAVFVRRDFAREAKGEAWLEAHDLVRLLARGEAPVWRNTPPCGSALGVPRVCLPQAEIDQTVLLVAAGAAEPALQRARRALELAPDHPDALGLAGLLELQAGETETARDLLERSVRAGVGEGLGKTVREELAGLDSGD